MSPWWVRFTDPRVEDRVLTERGEEVIQEVRRHWVTRIVPALEVGCGMVALVAMPMVGPWWWVLLLLALALGVRGFWRMHVEYMDRFVITNLRVFRVHGVIDQRFGMMPLARVLDVSVRTPVLGQIVGYGHLEIENAAQEQALREIHFVGDVEQVERILQNSVLDVTLGRSPDREDTQTITAG